MNKLKSRSYQFLLLTSFLSITPFLGYSAPVSPEVAQKEAWNFYNQYSHIRFKAHASEELSLVYKAGGEIPEFYIYNNAVGFIIISGDDRLPEVLGYSECGKFDYDKIPENFKWWLSEYEKEISAWLPFADQKLPSAYKRVPVKRPPIEPLTKTTWNQDAPYNNDCPLDYSGQRSVTGCVATAMAQLMKYHEWPKNPTGSSGGVVFDGTTYQWDRMLDNYVNGEYSGVEAAAVATLMRQCGAAVNMQYSSWSSGAYDSAVPYAFTKYFNYGPDIKMVWKDYTPLSNWTEIVYNELAAGRPLYYSGSSSQGGHAFVCDGYSENDFFHFNWGWGGYQDGYFRLTALNPASGGAGSYEGGYNTGQTILTGLAPNKNNKPIVNQYALISTGGFFYDKPNTFNIQQDPRGFNLIYNPLAAALTASLGVKIVESDNPSATPKYISAGSTTFQTGYGTGEIQVKIPNMPDGTYSITPVFSRSGGEWMPVLIPLGKQNYVKLIVKDGKQEFINDGADDSNKAILIVNDPITTPEIYGNADMAFKLPVLNVGKGDYMGFLGFTLVKKDDEFGDAVSFSDSAPVSGKGYLEWEIKFTDHLSPGQYLMYVSDDEYNILVDGQEISIKEGKLPIPKTDGKVKVEGLAPNFINSESENPIYFTVTSSSSREETITLRFVVIDAESFEKVKEFPLYSASIPAEYSGRLVIQPHDLEIQPGKYMWYVADASGNAISYSTPLIVTSPVKDQDGVAYYITDETKKKAMITSPESAPYTGVISVPEFINGYEAAALTPDAFAFSDAIEVTLPASIHEIPNGGFYDTYPMRQLNLEASDIVETGTLSFYPKYSSNCWLTVPENLAIPYHLADVWNNFQMTNWRLELKDVKITSGMEIDPTTGLAYAPYYVNCFTPLSIGFDAPEEKNVAVTVIHNSDWILVSTIDPKETKVELPPLGIRGWGRIIAEATSKPVGVYSMDSDNKPLNVYTIDGKLIIRNASSEEIRNLQPGLYIIGNRKHMVK